MLKSTIQLPKHGALSVTCQAQLSLEGTILINNKLIFNVEIDVEIVHFISCDDGLAKMVPRMSLFRLLQP